nr:LytTR family DNA-binding domain-containing protein [Nitrosomonas nitrosa]
MLEGSSLLITALLFFAVAWWESLWPVSPGRVPAKVIAHLVGSLAFSATHIVAMVAIRELYFHIVHNIDYTYIRNGFEDILYDYRKDSVTYITMLMLIYLTRGLEITRQEAVRDLQMASDEKRLALKCGGSTIFLAADKVEAVQGDGNYVFIHTASESFHARMTLIEAEKLLRSSGQSVIRVHKSWIIDREKIERISKNDKGDPIYQLRGKRIIKGSRRYRI